MKSPENLLENNIFLNLNQNSKLTHRLVLKKPSHRSIDYQWSCHCSNCGDKCKDSFEFYGSNFYSHYYSQILVSMLSLLFFINAGALKNDLYMAQIKQKSLPTLAWKGTPNCIHDEYPYVKLGWIVNIFHRSWVYAMNFLLVLDWLYDSNLSECSELYYSSQNSRCSMKWYKYHDILGKLLWQQTQKMMRLIRTQNTITSNIPYKN